ncbi:MAG TPA: hypothetical protein DC047_10700 [Blastocatellia bacterium]|nr:hypothetical protein [Blastocatellia bacterium]
MIRQSRIQAPGFVAFVVRLFSLSRRYDKLKLIGRQLTHTKSKQSFLLFTLNPYNLVTVMFRVTALTTGD